MQGVTALQSNYHNVVSLAAGATQIAAWNNNDSLIATQPVATHTTVGVTAHLAGGATWSGDFPRVIANAGRWLKPAGCSGPTPTPTPLCGTFTNTTAIAIPDSGAAAPYPSTINVTGTSGTVTNVTVKLKNLSHTWGNDVDVLLVGPGGQKMRLMENAGTGATTNSTLTFSDSAAVMLPQTGALPSGTYKPTAYAPATTYPAPAPAGPYGTTLAVFNGTGANGTWSLYVFDDGPGDSGSFAGGWELSILTTNCVAPTPTPTPTCMPRTFIFEGNSAISGTAGNIRTFTVSGVTVNVSGFSRRDSNGAWTTSWLGLFSEGAWESPAPVRAMVPTINTWWTTSAATGTTCCLSFPLRS